MTIRSAVRGCAQAGLALLGWTAIMLAMPFVGPGGRGVAVVGPVAAIPAAGGRVVEVRRGAVLARGEGRNFVARLYRNGARIVLEGRIGAGCFPVAS